MGLIGDPWGLPMVPEMTNFDKSLFFGLESRTMAQNDPIDNLERLSGPMGPIGDPLGPPHGPRIYQFLKKSTFF